jgi:pyruvyltransferase
MFFGLRKKNNDFILAYWWLQDEEGMNNWGDLLNHDLIQEISGKKLSHITGVENINHEPVYIAIGSILGHNLSFCKNNLEIWGTGFMFKNDLLNTAPKEIHAVRGHLTRNILLSQGYACPEVYGDPALLYPRFYKSKSKKRYKLGIIPHYFDKKLIPSDFQDDPDVLIIDIQSGIHRVIDQICSCRKVVSSSLHGIIAADAYGVPSKWLELSDNVSGNGFKFYDYFSSVGRTNEKAIKLNDDTSIDDLLDEFDHYKLDFNADELWNACPFKP